MIGITSDPAIARTELMDWYDEMRERAYTARFSLALADMEKEITMNNEAPLPRGPFEEPSNAAEPQPDSGLEIAVRALAIWRVEATEVKAKAIALENEMLTSRLGRQVLRAKDEAKDLAAAVRDSENDVRRLAFMSFEMDGNRKPHKAITIKHYKTPIIVDADLLLDHVRIHVPQCVKLDTRQVAKLARAGLEMPYVEFEEEYRATIAAKLDKWLPEAPAGESAQ